MIGAIAADKAWDEEERERNPCRHPGCASHVTHPCEGCGRIMGGFDNHPRCRLDYFIRRTGVYYFILATGRRVAVSGLEARLSRLCDSVLTDDATELDRARHLAEHYNRSVITLIGGS